MKKYKVEDVLSILKNDHVTKEEVLFIMQLYNQNLLAENSDVTKKDLLKQIKKVNNSLLLNENNKLVSNRLDKVIDIINEVCEIKEEEGPQIDKLYYELGLLSYEQNLNLEKPLSLEKTKKITLWRSKNDVK
jgi:hypothetical protein